jgi:hypothetical protein
MRSLILFSLFALVLYGCVCPLTDCTVGSGSVVTEDRSIDSFDSIELSSAASVTYTQSTSGSLQIEAEDNLINSIETKVENGILKIYDKKTQCFTNTLPIRISVGSENISKISILGSGKVTSTNTIKTESLELVIMGSGDIDTAVQSKSINAEIPGSGTIRLGGNTSILDASILGSGAIKAYNLSADSAKVDITGSGAAEVFVNKELNASIFGSGSIDYKGNATVTKNEFGSGDVEDMN